MQTLEQRLRQLKWLREYQVVVRTKPNLTVYIRKTPYTILYPTPAQKDVRDLFKKAAELAKGMKGLAPDGLPWAAYFVKLFLSGYRSLKRKERVPKWLERYVMLRRVAPLLKRPKPVLQV